MCELENESMKIICSESQWKITCINKYNKTLEVIQDKNFLKTLKGVGDSLAVQWLGLPA